MSRFFTFILEQRFLIVFLVITIVVLGAWSWHRLPIDAFPDVTNVQVMILTEALGLSPVDVERQVTFPIEIQMNGLPGVREVRSLSKTGFSQVIVVFEDNYDTYFTRQIVFERLQLAKDELPVGIEPELGPISTGLGEIYQYTLESDDYSPMELRTMQDWIIAPQLRSIPGVNEVNSFGGFVKQYHVLIKPEMLVKYGVTVTDVFAAVQANNANAGGSFITQGWEQYNIRSVGLIETIGDIDNIVVEAEDGTPVYLKNIADIQIGRMTRMGAVTRDGKGESVAGMVIMLKDENSKIVVDKVKQKIPDIQKSLPAGVKIDSFYDRTSLIQGCINTITGALSRGGIFVILILFLFLWNFRAALIVAFTLPFSALVSFILMELTGVTANLMSLGGIAIALGIIVDGAIVFTENIVDHLREQHPPETSKLEIVRAACIQVARPVIFAILIIIIVFFPLFTLEQMEGKMFKPLAITLCYAMIGSLVAACIVVPVFGYLILPIKTGVRDNPIVKALNSIYLPILTVVLRFRWPVIIVTIALLVGTLLQVPKLGTEFLPNLDERAIAINIVRLPTASLEGSRDVGILLEKRLLKYEEIETIVTKTGRAEISEDPMGPEQNDMFIMLKPYHEWDEERTKEDLIKDIESEMQQIPGIRPSFSQPIALRVNELISGIKSDVAIKLFGDDLEILQEKAEEIANILGRLGGAEDVKVEQISGLEQIELHIDRARIARHKINVQDINNMVEIAVGGKVASTVVEGQMRFGIQVRFPEYARNNVEAISKILVPSPLGYNVTLGSLVEIEKLDSPAQVSRENSLRRVVVECNIRGRDMGSFIEEARNNLDKIRGSLPAGYFLEFGGQFENQQRAMKRLMIVIPVSIFLIFLMLFSSFRSVRSAVLVLTTLPFALVGGILTILVLDINLSVSSAIGFIALFGIAVEDGMVLVTFMNELKEKGKSTMESILTGCRMRLRPVVMTSMTTFLGLLPMIYSTGAGSEIQRPLAIVVLGGLISALGLTLFVLPVLYSIFVKE